MKLRYLLYILCWLGFGASIGVMWLHPVWAIIGFIVFCGGMIFTAPRNLDDLPNWTRN